MSSIEFAHPWYFLLLPLPLLVYWLVPAYHSRESAIKVPFFSQILEALNESPREAAGLLTSQWWQKATLFISWLLIVTALAHPSILGEVQTREEFGRDVMVVVDLSGSMAEQDFTTDGKNLTRLQAAKQVLKEFVDNREGDRFGLILFGDSAFVQTPFTADRTVWLSLLNESDVAMAGQSTNLGDAMGLGIKVFEQNRDPEQQKVMIVLTDGNDTGSFVEPIDAAKIAAAKGIKIYIIAMGDPETVGEQPLDMDVIERVSTLTKARSFTAIDQQALSDAYKLIDELEPQTYSTATYRPNISLHHYLIIALVVMHLLVFGALTIKRIREVPNE